jgi:hypothetical protein
MLGWPLGQVKRTSLCFYTMRAGSKFDEILIGCRIPKPVGRALCPTKFTLTWRWKDRIKGVGQECPTDVA